MINAISSSISALQSIGKKVGVSANNIANSNTTGFKKSRASSTEVSSGSSGSGSALSEISESFSQGALVATGSSTDLALSGDGYFIVSGNSGETYYTRDGSFQFDAQGRLADSSGNVVQGWALDTESGEISGSLGDIALDASTEATGVSVSQDGIVSVTNSDGETADLFQIAVARFADTDGLEKVGGNLYTATTESGGAIVGAPGTNALGSIVSQSLEESNVDLAEEMVNMTILQRSYEANLKVVQTEDEMTGDVLDIIS